MATDINLNGKAALAWAKKVDEENKEIRILLKQVNQACREYSGADNDPIIKATREASEELEERWNGLCNTLDDTVSKLGSAFTIVDKAIQKALEKVTGLTK